MTAGIVWERIRLMLLAALAGAALGAAPAGAQDQTTEEQAPAAGEQSAAGAAGDAATEEAAPEPNYPVTVTVGAYVNDIQQLDLTTHSYNVDFYLWFRWTDPAVNPSTTLEFMNSFQLWGHILTPLSEEPEQLADGSYYIALRNQGQFNTKLPLEHYPFDKQQLTVEFEDSSLPSDKLIYVADTNPITLNPEIGLPGYHIGAPTMTIVDKPYPTAFGDTSASAPPSYFRVTLSIPVSRPTWTYALKLLLPILIVVASAAMMLLVHPHYVDGRIGIGITALLTLVALQLTMNSQLPEVDYLMMMDKVYFAAYLFVVVGLALVVRGSWLAGRDEIGLAVRRDRAALLALTASYIVVTALIIVVTLI